MNHLIKVFGLVMMLTVAMLAAMIQYLQFSIYKYMFHVTNIPGTYQISDDVYRNIFELIESRGFIYEQHFVTTPDGYILQLVRMVNPFIKIEDRIRLRPILLHHGYQCSGTIWLVAMNGHLDHNGNYYEMDEQKQILTNSSNQMGNSLGFILTARGYDVWLANYRGSIYSRNHTHLDIESSEYWKFSMDQLIKYDLPVQIDYIISYTKHTKLSYIAHSQGALIMFALMSMNNSYAEKIEPFIALAPAFCSFHSKVDSLFKYSASMRNVFLSYPQRFPPLIISSLLRTLCQNYFIKHLCFVFNYLIVGTQKRTIFPERLPIYIGAETMGASTWVTAHLMQLILKNDNMMNSSIDSETTKECQLEYFDYGEAENLRFYGQRTPPIYDVAKINSTKIALIYAKKDFLIGNSVQSLKSKLNVKLLDDYEIPDQTYSHMDLFWAKNSGEMVNKKVLEILNST